MNKLRPGLDDLILGGIEILMLAALYWVAIR